MSRRRVAPRRGRLETASVKPKLTVRFARTVAIGGRRLKGVLIPSFVDGGVGSVSRTQTPSVCARVRYAAYTCGAGGRRRSVLWTGLVALSICTSGCFSARAPQQSSPPATTIELFEQESGDKNTFYLKASDQYGDGGSIVLDEVVVTGGHGYVVIHGDGRGEFSDAVGVSDVLPPGTNKNVTVEFDSPLRSSGRVYPMIHLDSNANGVYDFPAADGPARVRGRTVILLVQIYVQ